MLWKCQRHFKRDQFKELEENVYQYSPAQTADGLALIETASPLSWPDTDWSLSDRRLSAPGSIAAILTPWQDIKGSLGKRCTKARPSRLILSEFNIQSCFSSIMKPKTDLAIHRLFTDASSVRLWLLVFTPGNEQLFGKSCFVFGD